MANKVQGVRGEIGEIYTTSNGFIRVDDVVADDLVTNGIPAGTSGWRQVSESERVSVLRKQLSHSMCYWDEA